MRRLALCLVAACGGGGSTTPDAPITPAPNPAREVVDTKLSVDVSALTATATITLGPSTSPGASLEIGDLTIESVTTGGTGVPYVATNAELDLGLAASDDPITVEIAYRIKYHEGFQGLSMSGFTFTWPYFCGNLFPCHSDPADGTTFSSVELTGVPAGVTAVFPPAIANQAPSYQLAWSIDAYTELPLGTTTAGTNVSVWYRTGELAAAQTGTAHLVAAFDWFEKTLGPYRFGDHVGSVSVRWPAGAFGGMEHHPRWHVASAALSDEVTNVHESAHGWFGDGIRIGCWEDFVLSEGTVSYLAGRALDVVAPTVGTATWNGYASELHALPASDPVWPQSCGSVDVLKDNLFTNAPYMRGAFFYRAVALKVGADVLDHALSTFFQAHGGATGRVTEMLQTIHDVTGYDATACAQMWLEDMTQIPAIGPCP